MLKQVKKEMSNQVRRPRGNKHQVQIAKWKIILHSSSASAPCDQIRTLREAVSISLMSCPSSHPFKQEAAAPMIAISQPQSCM